MKLKYLIEKKEDQKNKAEILELKYQDQIKNAEMFELKKENLRLNVQIAALQTQQTHQMAMGEEFSFTYACNQKV